MSIQPNRVLARIIEQVESSDWPPLESKLHSTADGSEWIRFFCAPIEERYATPFHFWVHALRDDLEAHGRGADLMGVAGYALCQSQSWDDWRSEVGENAPVGDADEPEATIYRMQASECRRSSVAMIGERFMAHFWGHGFAPSWRRKVLK